MQHDDSQGGAVPRTIRRSTSAAGPRSTRPSTSRPPGSEHGGVERPPAEAKPRESPVEQTHDDPDMTGGQVVTGPGEPGGPDPAPPSTPPQEAAESGGRQSMPGARPSDRIAGQPD